MAEVLMAKQGNWIKGFDYLSARIGQIGVLLQQPQYSDVNSQRHQELRIERLNTEFYLREHLKNGQGDGDLQALAQARLATETATRLEPIGGTVCSNYGQAPFADVGVPANARAAWYSEVWNSFTETAA